MYHNPENQRFNRKRIWVEASTERKEGCYTRSKTWDNKDSSRQDRKKTKQSLRKEIY